MNSIGRRAVTEGGAGGLGGIAALLQARVAGALKRNVAEEKEYRKIIEERKERWGVNHPSRARLRDLNF